MRCTRPCCLRPGGLPPGTGLGRRLVPSSSRPRPRRWCCKERAGTQRARAVGGAFRGKDAAHHRRFAARRRPRRAGRKPRPGRRAGTLHRPRGRIPGLPGRPGPSGARRRRVLAHLLRSRSGAFARPAGGAMIAISDEVRFAIERGTAVALETSVVAQGLPPPQNLESARRCARAVREAGAVPAAVAVIGGRVVVGATDADLLRLSDPQRRPAKAGVRDLAALCAAGADAGTTVSATCAIAAQAGIRVFATGGIGGVHRRAAPGEPPDVSSGVIVCVPPPSPLPRAEVERALSAALGEAAQQRLAGKELTPFLLARLAAASGGRTLQSNLDLLEENARAAAGIALALGARA